MISKNISKLPKSQIEVAITVPWEDLQTKWNETLQRLSLDVELPGFRKGQAPLNMVESQLGTKLQDEVLKAIMPQALVEALQGLNIIPIDYPKYQSTSFVKGQSLNFKALITEKPEVKMGDYKNIKAVRPQLKTVTDEDVFKMIGDLYNRWKVRQPSMQAVSQTKPSTNGQLDHGSGSISFNQPQTTQSQVSSNGYVPPSGTAQDKPDDAFAKAVGANDLADLKTKIKQDLESEAKYNNELDFEEAILQEVEKITQVELPDVLVEDELNRMLVSLQRRVADMGLLLDDYLKRQGKGVEQLKLEWRPQSEKNVRMELGLSEIARAENIQIADEQLQAEIDKIQDGRLKAQFEAQEPRMHLRHSLRQVKTLDLLKTLVKMF